jgi:small subunit ribosomal protein S6
LAENVYEGMFILDSNQYGRDPGGVSDQIPKMLEGAGGSVMVSRLWEERRLAFPIKGHRKGTYWLTYFRLDSSRLAGIQRQCELSDTIVRSLFLKVDPRIVDALVEHALVARPQSSETDAKAEKEPDARDEDAEHDVPVGAAVEEDDEE